VSVEADPAAPAAPDSEGTTDSEGAGAEAGVDAAAEASPPLLELRGASLGYGPLTVVPEMDFAVGEGECVALLGRNGMGKTTLLRGMAAWGGLQSGRRIWRGGDATRAPARALARDGLLLVPEDRGVFGGLTVRENLLLGARRRVGRGERLAPAFPELEPMMGRRAGGLSGGERQMLALSRALASEPRLLLLDEATEGLSPRAAGRVWEMLEELRARRLSMVVVDKNWRRAARMADRVALLVKGRVAAATTGREALESPAAVLEALGVDGAASPPSVSLAQTGEGGSPPEAGRRATGRGP